MSTEIQQEAGLMPALRAQKPLFASILVFGTFVNMLVLTGPFFALQIYDRVLGSRSVETLIALSVLMAFLFLVMGILDHVRKRIAARIGERLVSRLERRVFDFASLSGDAPEGLRNRCVNDLEMARQFFASPVFIALFDLPWVPVFLFGIGLFHPALGWFSLIGAVVFILPGLLNLAIRGSGRPGDRAEFQEAQGWMQHLISDPEAAQNIPLKSDLFLQWARLRNRARSAALLVQDKKVALASVSQTFRLFLQSAIIALGAYLVLLEQMSAGAIIAATVLLARALGPLDLIAQNAVLLRSQIETWKRLAGIPDISAKHPVPAVSIHFKSGVKIEQLTVFPPRAKHPALRMVTANIRGGSALGIIGPTGSGKSTLARAIVGLWPAAGGRIKLGDVPIERLDSDILATRIGYLAQQLRMLDGTIAQNIAGFRANFDTRHVVKAAKTAGAHDMIISLAEGYETRISSHLSGLSAGLVQRIGLARATFGNPDLLVLDEPANNLDSDGLITLNEIVEAAVARNASVVICSQRPFALSLCKDILVLHDGLQKDLGPAKSIFQRNLPAPAATVPLISSGTN